MSEEIEMSLENGKVKIDAELAPLIRELNKAGLITTHCCSGHGTQDAYVSIALSPNVKDIAIREHPRHGRRLVIWWDSRPPLRPNHKEIVHSEV